MTRFDVGWHKVYVPAGQFRGDFAQAQRIQRGTVWCRVEMRGGQPFQLRQPRKRGTCCAAHNKEQGEGQNCPAVQHDPRLAANRHGSEGAGHGHPNSARACTLKGA